MTAQSSRHDDTTSSGDKLPSTAMPPTLFTLPNLASVSEASPSECELPSEPKEAASADGNVGLTACEATHTAHTITSQPSDLADTEERCQTQSVLVFEDQPETASGGSTIQFEPIQNEQTDAPKPYLATEQSLLGTWGTRTIVIGLLAIAVTAAVIAARKQDNKTSQSSVAQGEPELVDELDVALDISEGISMAQIELPAESSVADESQQSTLATQEPVSETTPDETQLAAQSSAAPSATLSAPVLETGIDTSLHSDPISAAVATTTAPTTEQPVDDTPAEEIVAEEAIAATVVSARTTDPSVDVTPPGPVTPAVNSPPPVVTNPLFDAGGTNLPTSAEPRQLSATQSPTSPLATPQVTARKTTAPSVAAPATTQMTAPQTTPSIAVQPATALTAPATATLAVPAAKSTAAAEPAAAPVPAATTAETEQPQASEAIRYSSTPNAISDLIRFLPPKPDKTTSP